MVNKTYTSVEEIPVMMTVDEMAALLRIGRNTAYSLVRNQEIPSIRVGKQFRIYRGDIINYQNSLSIPVFSATVDATGTLSNT